MESKRKQTKTKPKTNELTDKTERDKENKLVITKGKGEVGIN